MDKIDKYLWFQAIDNIISAETRYNLDSEKLEDILSDLKKVRTMLEDF